MGEEEGGWGVAAGRAVSLASREADDSGLLRHRIVTRMFYRLGGDTLKAFVEARAPELTVEPFESDADLGARVANGGAVDLVIWRQQATDTDAIAGVKATLGATNRGPALLIVDRYHAPLGGRAVAHRLARLGRR